MNEKIKELMLEAGYAAPELAGRANKLAELIVKECIAICNDTNDASYLNGVIAGRKIKKHFGIDRYTQEELDEAHHRGVELAKKLRVE